MKTKEYFKIYPEVPASYSSDTVFDRSGAPLKVKSASLLWEGSLGSDLFEISPIFFATERLVRLLDSTNLTGFLIGEEIDVKPSENLLELDNNPIIPKVMRLIIYGSSSDDFLTDNGVLIVSSKALEYLQKLSLEGAEVIAQPEA